MSTSRSLSLIDVIVATGVLAVAAALLATSSSMTRATSRQQVDADQIRTLHQGMITWAMSSDNSYPLPSELDPGHQTLPNGVKDLTRDIVSILIFNGFIKPEVCISPAETNGNLVAYDRYQYTQPAAAAATDKRLALWDPAFRALNTDAARLGNTAGEAGGFSYAHVPPIGARRSKWDNVWNDSTAVIGNRGPAYTATGMGASLTWNLFQSTSNPGGGVTPEGVNSRTLRIHGSRTAWEGNIAYGDNHVAFETSHAPASLPFRFYGLPPALQIHPDNLFANESDFSRAPLVETCNIESGAGAPSNNFLRAYAAAIQPVSGNVTGPLQAIQPWYD